MTYQIAGVLQSPPDQRDYIYIPRTLNLPRAFSRRQYVVEYEDQGRIGACVANGGASTLETYANHFGQVHDLSRAFIYNAGRHMEGRLGQSGMFVRTLYKVLRNHGVCAEAVYPYSDDSEAGEIPPEHVYNLASPHKIDRYEFIVARNSVYGTFERQQKIDRIKAALLEGLIPTVAWSVTDSIRHMKGPWRGQDYKLIGPGNEPIGGHLMYVVGWDDDAGRFEVVNSWGQGWGDYGVGGFPYAVVDQPGFESWVFRGFAGMNVPEWPGIKLEYANEFSIGFRIVPRPEELGRPVSVWVGAMLGDKLFLKQGQSSDVWARQVGTEYPPSFHHTLAEDNPLKAVNWMWDLDQFKGAVVYVAYGQTPLDWTLVKLCTI